MTIDNDVLRERISLLGSFLGEAISRQTANKHSTRLKPYAKVLSSNAGRLTQRTSNNSSTLLPR